MSFYRNEDVMLRSLENGTEFFFLQETCLNGGYDQHLYYIYTRRQQGYEFKNKVVEFLKVLL